MIEFCLHPDVYATGASTSLRRMLEAVWVREHRSGDGHLVIVSGFGNYNGGVRFYPQFVQHVRAGGALSAVFSGSSSRRLTSRQLVAELLRCGARVTVVNRNRMLHAKCYGAASSDGESLVVSSGNFTGPGMSHNAEASVRLGPELTADIGFSWDGLLGSLRSQDWLTYDVSLDDPDGPGWSLLYDETVPEPVPDESDLVTMVLVLGHADTARIQADPHTDAAKGTQYFWLSKDCYDFFPPLTIPNTRGRKRTYSCLVTLHYVDIGVTDPECRVTFEAENNLDFRLGTGKLRYTKVARQGDLAVICRTADSTYELRIAKQGTAMHDLLSPYAVSFIGHQGKRYGFLQNDRFEQATGITLPSVP